MAMTPVSGSPVAPVSASTGRVIMSPTRMALERFMHNKAAVISVIVLVIIIGLSVIGPLFTPYSPTTFHLNHTNLPPSPQHWFGTDDQGRDYLTRDLYGGRVDLMIGFSDMLIIMVISIILGGLAGYFGGWVDALIMRFVDLMLNFPLIIFIIVLQAVLGVNNAGLLILVIGILGWPQMTRFIRGLFLNLRESEFVLAAKISGSGVWRIILKHMLPNALGPLLVLAAFNVASNIFLEAALAIIGFGVPEPAASWGNVLNGAQNYFTLRFDPWAWVPPAVLLSLTILCINFIGDGLRDAFDPSFEK